MGKNTLIIGANSQLGRMLRQQWRGAAGVLWLSRAQWAAADGAAALRGFLDGVDVILCLAGATPGAGVDFTLNEAIGSAVVRAAGPSRHVFLTSTQAVYGGGSGPHAEDGPVAPENEYGRSKLQMEQSAARLAEACGTRLTLLRLGNIVGADMLFRNIAAGRAITLDQFADGRGPVRSYLDPERLAQALETLIAMARAGASLPGVLNLASDPPLDMAAMLRAAGVAFETRAAPASARPQIAMDVGLARGLLPCLAEPVDADAAVAAWRRDEALA